LDFLIYDSYLLPYIHELSSTKIDSGLRWELILQGAIGATGGKDTGECCEKN